MLKKQAADDLFEKSSMSFGEHLEELRKALGKAFIWLGIGTAIGLYFATDIVAYIEKPLRLAIADFYVAQAKQDYKLANGVEPSDKLAEWITANEIMPERVFIDPRSLASMSDMPIAEISTVAANEQGNSEVKNGAVATADKANAAKSAATESATTESATTESATTEATATESNAAKPSDENSPAAKTVSHQDSPWKGIDLAKLERLQPFLLFRPIPNKLVSLTITEGFMIWLKAAMVAGVVIGSPGIFWHIWQFLAAGLYPHERRYVYWYLPLSLLLFLSGVALAFFVIFRLVLGFLMTYTAGLNVEFTPRLSDYMSFALMLPLGFGLAFQLPILMLGLHRFGVVSAETFLAQWRIAVLTIAFLSMVLTPADIYSMLGLFIPLVGLYFLGILLCNYMPRGAGIGGPAVDPRG